MQPSGSASVGGGGSFRVDLAQAPEAIDELKSALAQLRDIRADAAALGAFDAGSRDSVSIEAAQLIGRAAVGGQGSLVDALDAGIARVADLINSMQHDLTNYETSDGMSARSFSGQNSP